MIMPETGIDWLAAVIALAAGLVFGLAFFASLRRTLRYYADGRPIAGGLLHGLRFLVLAVVLAGAAQFGALPLLTCTLGLFVARRLVLRGVRKAP